MTDVKLPKEEVLQFVGEALQLEQRNMAMNYFIGSVVEQMRVNEIYTLLIKGQGVAQCYERPLWRASGDIDFYLSEVDYKKAIQYLRPLSSTLEEDNTGRMHIALTIDQWVVELHGSLKSGMWKSLDNTLEDVHDEIFCGGAVRSWMNDKTQVFLPRADEDVFIVFAHILQHCFQEGIGLRQICDWCRLMWTYKDIIKRGLLESHLKNAGVMTEWNAFASLAINELGMSLEAIPIYSNRKVSSIRAKKICSFIFETGYFGHNRDYSFYEKYPFIVYKAISFWRHLKDFGIYFVIFPKNAVKVKWNRVCLGFKVALK